MDAVKWRGRRGDGQSTDRPEQPRAVPGRQSGRGACLHERRETRDERGRGAPGVALNWEDWSEGAREGACLLWAGRWLLLGGACRGTVSLHGRLCACTSQSTTLLSAGGVRSCAFGGRSSRCSRARGGLGTGEDQARALDLRPGGLGLGAWDVRGKARAAILQEKKLQGARVCAPSLRQPPSAHPPGHPSLSSPLLSSSPLPRALRSRSLSSDLLPCRPHFCVSYLASATARHCSAALRQSLASPFHPFCSQILSITCSPPRRRACIFLILPAPSPSREADSATRQLASFYPLSNISLFSLSGCLPACDSCLLSSPAVQGRCCVSCKSPAFTYILCLGHSLF